MKKWTKRKKNARYPAEKTRKGQRGTLRHIIWLATSTFNISENNTKTVSPPREAPALVFSRFQSRGDLWRKTSSFTWNQTSECVSTWFLPARLLLAGIQAKYANPIRFITLGAFSAVRALAAVVYYYFQGFSAGHKRIISYSSTWQKYPVLPPFQRWTRSKSDNDVIYYHLSGWRRADCFWRSLTPHCIWNKI